ncbi:MAG: glutathione S-transferase family protein [Polyangiaceae bacterium]
MALILYYHPLASYCHKVLMALYENETPFEKRVIDLYDPTSSAELQSLWPMKKLPVLRDEARNCTVGETSIIIEYLDTKYPGALSLVPTDAELSLEARLWDRIFDLYVNSPMQKIVTDRLRPAGQGDALGVEDAKQTLRTVYDLIEARMESRNWALGDAFSIADCAAAPALFFAEVVQPFAATHPNLTGYFARLAVRASFAKVMDEARPYFHLFPLRDEMPSRFNGTLRS